MSHKGRQGKVVLRRVPVLFRYRFYAEMSRWDEKKPTRYRAKAGPEVVLRKVSVLFRYRFYAEMSHWDEKKPTRYCATRSPAGGGSYFIYSECRILLWCFIIISS